jgi:DNA-directed RNA polymerase subunit RPC12/RpoP
MPIAILGHPLAYGVVVAAAMLAGWRYGRGKGWYKCATCGEILPAALPPACPGCGGTIRARIRSPMDRLAIEEGQQ